MEASDFLRNAVIESHNMSDIAMTDLTPEVVQYRPGGTANTIQALIAHLTMGEDNAINRAALSGTSLFESGGWSVKTGIPAERGGQWTDGWQLNLGAFEEYRRAVHAATNVWVESVLPKEDLGREAFWFNGPRPLGKLLSTVLYSHVFFHGGEISSLKGAQGLKGLPF